MQRIRNMPWIPINSHLWQIPWAMVT